MRTFLSTSNFADLLGTSIATTQKWGETGVYPYHSHNGKMGFYMEELTDVEPVQMMLSSNWDEEKHVTPLRDFTSLELFAGAGGLTLGMHLAKFRHILLNKIDPMASETLRLNRPDWNVLEGDVHKIDFTPLRVLVDLITISLSPFTATARRISTTVRWAICLYHVPHRECGFRCDK